LERGFGGKEVYVEHESKIEGKEVDFLPAFVFLKNGLFINEILIKKGVAKVNEKDEFELKEDFEDLEESAQGNRLGIWVNYKE